MMLRKCAPWFRSLAAMAMVAVHLLALPGLQELLHTHSHEAPEQHATGKVMRSACCGGHGDHAPADPESDDCGHCCTVCCHAGHLLLPAARAVLASPATTLSKPPARDQRLRDGPPRAIEQPPKLLA